ncbi:MAG: ParB N-terminal domain-containing protein [bacterium]
MRTELLPVTGLHLDPANARKHSSRNLEAVKASLARFGQQKPIVIDKDNIVRAGNGTLEAAKALGWEEISIVRSELIGPEMTAFAIADNRTAELAEWDMEALAKTLKALPRELASEGTGFSASEAVEMFDALKMPEGEDSVYTPEQDVPFTEEEIKDAAWEFFQKLGMQFRSVAAFEAMSMINALAVNKGGLSAHVKVADWKQPHRVAARVAKMKTLHEGLAEEDTVKKSVGISIGEGNTITRWSVQNKSSGIRGVQTAKNFWPGVARDIYRQFGGGRVLDTSTGYGGRLVGALASGCVSHYIGIDPNKDTCDGNEDLLNELNRDDFATLINLPAEDVSADMVGAVDMAFTSPPYFSKEHYSDDDTQSWKRYGQDYSALVDGFLKPTFRLMFECLKPGGFCVFNIEDVTLNGKVVPLVESSEKAAFGAGFQAKPRQEIPMPRAGWVDKDRSEILLVFWKPDQ